ncbi:hypothetical protein Cni_G15317 [Canna indica]|uniref:Uncharacterized protein n=1 Tax=Canna indica TaxID=4628 RepID=A0AAQ3QER6_9LILI|nr:hypothetical protein Cni_G15317 [Canna indica]
MDKVTVYPRKETDAPRHAEPGGRTLQVVVPPDTSPSGGRSSTRKLNYMNKSPVK